MPANTKVIDGKILKECAKCKEFKELSEYYVDATKFLATSSYCKVCLCEYRTSPEVNRKAKLKLRYNITPEEYNKLYKQQNGNCSICENKFEVLNVDHDHNTDIVRGLLCGSCNRGLGLFRDDAIILEKALRYIKERKIG